MWKIIVITIEDIFKCILAACIGCDLVMGEEGGTLPDRGRASLTHSMDISSRGQPIAPGEFGNAADGCATEKLG